MKTLLFITFVWTLIFSVVGKDRGELSIDITFPLEEKQQQKFAKKLDSHSLSVLLQKAQVALGNTPQPLEVIIYEGRLNTDKDRIKSVAALGDMQDAVCLTYAACFKTKLHLEFIQKFKTLILSWAKIYKPTGNPVNENKLLPLLTSYITLKNHFAESEQIVIEKWVKALAQKHLNLDVPLNNWYAKRIKIVLYSGLILNDKNMKDWSYENYKNYLNIALKSDGRSSDLIERDAMSYHVSALKSLLEIAILFSLDSRGRELYNGSLAKSINFVLPYIKGEKVYAQWRNSTVALDKQRSKTDMKEYKIGAKWNPEKSYDMLILGSFFDPKIAEYKKYLKGSNLFLETIIRTL